MRNPTFVLFARRRSVRAPILSLTCESIPAINRSSVECVIKRSNAKSTYGAIVRANMLTWVAPCRRWPHLWRLDVRRSATPKKSMRSIRNRKSPAAAELVELQWSEVSRYTQLDWSNPILKPRSQSVAPNIVIVPSSWRRLPSTGQPQLVNQPKLVLY